MTLDQMCPCCSQRLYKACCGPYLVEGKRADGVEALMRSRYTAFVYRQLDYILQTMSGKALEVYKLNQDASDQDSLLWEGLLVEVVSETGDTGRVDFTASFSISGRQGVHRERSYFEKIKGCWYYVDGDVR